MQARVKAGWIKEEDLAPPPAEAEPAEAEARGLTGHSMPQAMHATDHDVLDAGSRERTAAGAERCAWRQARCGRSKR